MNPEAQRIAIAEACGWIREYADVQTWDASLFRYKPVKTLLFRREGNCVLTENLPDYIADLNAMNQAEETLTDEQWISYLIKLLQAARDGSFVIEKNMKTVAHATATQRVEAFIRTLGKWEEAA